MYVMLFFFIYIRFNCKKKKNCKAVSICKVVYSRVLNTRGGCLLIFRFFPHPLAPY